MEHQGVVDAIASSTVVLVPSIVLGELHAAFKLGSRQRENQQRLEEFIAEAFVNVADVTSVTARFYGDIFCALRSAGTPIPLNDVWISAVTFESGGHLLTFDGDFAKVVGLQHTLLPVPH